jgi:hypothetical protein
MTFFDGSLILNNVEEDWRNVQRVGNWKELVPVGYGLGTMG